MGSGEVSIPYVDLVLATTRPFALGQTLAEARLYYSQVMWIDQDDR
jgi:hypothetical protein